MTLDPNWLRSSFPLISGLAQIGRGGQKWVYGGTHPTDGSIVLKLFHPLTNPDRALREVGAAQRVCCPRVPQVLEVGSANSSFGSIIWLREQRIAGEDLRKTVNRGPLAPEAILRVGLHTLEALEAAERVNIVHRDVKPDNILHATDGTFWLLDFGLARHLDLDSLTATGATMGVGTFGYTPTEQFRNQKDNIDARADLFSLGVTLYECATGLNPFRQGTNDYREMQRRIENQPLAPITRQIDSSNQFRDLVLTMTRIRREQRPATAAEALEWMREICQREGIS